MWCRWFIWSSLAGALAALPAPLSAQQDSTAPPPPDTAPRPALTPEQQAYMDGLRTVSRGMAQLRTGLARLITAQGGRDTATVRRAGLYLGSVCRSAGTFLATGRPQMRPAAYADSTRLAAHALRVRVDSIAAYLPDCQRLAPRAPKVVTDELARRIANYEGALRAYRTAIGLPNR